MEEEVGQLVSQARKLQGEGDLDGAMAEVRKGLARYPAETRIEALKETLEREIALSGRRRARLSDLEEVKSLSLRAPAASTAELDSIQERTHTVAASYPGETEFLSLAQEIDRIARERAPVKPEEPERPRFRRPSIPARLPRPVLWGTAAVVAVILLVVILVFAIRVFRTAHARRPKSQPPPAIALVPVHVQVSPPGASVRIDGKIRDLSQPVSLPAGRYQVEASLDGYESAGATLGVTPGSLPAVDLTLRPVAQSFRITTPDLEDALVYIDHQLLGKLAGGTLRNPSLAVGRHNVVIRVPKALGERAGFAFESSPGQPPRVELPLAAKGAELVVITSQGSLGSIAGTVPSRSVKLDGGRVGALTAGGLALTNLQPGIHTLALGEGNQARTMSFESGPSPQLNAVIYSDRNVGSVLVLAGEDDADVYVDGRKYRYTTKGGELRIPNLAVRKHTIRVSKEGFSSVDEHPVTVVKGQEASVKFSLQALPKPATLEISHLPNGARIEIDQQFPAAAVVDGEFSRSGLTPGQHTIDVFAPGFSPQHVTKTFAAGDELRLTGHDFALERPMSTLEIAAAADTGLTIQRGGQTVSQFKGPTRLSLAEGEYQITAHGPGRVDTFTTVTLGAGETRKLDLSSRKNGMELWPEGWTTQNSGWFGHRGGGFVLYDRPRLAGTVEFTARLPAKRNPLGPSPRLKWVVNFLDDQNYLLFQMDSKYFYRIEVIDGDSVVLPKIAHHIPEHSASVNLQIRVHAGHVEHRWNLNGEDWNLLDDLARRPSLTGSAQGFNDGRFGFFLPGNEEVEVSNFSFYPGGG